MQLSPQGNRALLTQSPLVVGIAAAADDKIVTIGPQGKSFALVFPGEELEYVARITPLRT